MSIIIAVRVFLVLLALGLAIHTVPTKPKYATFRVPGFSHFAGRAIAASVVAGSTFLLPFQNNRAIADDVVVTATLTASDLKKNDLAPRIALLKDIQFVVSLLPAYVEKQEYTSIRQTLRSEPTVELRRTCKELPKYLDAADAKAFNVAYNDLIDSINFLDVTALKRLQGAGVPSSKDVRDAQMFSLTEDAGSKFSTLLSVLNNYQ